MKNKVVEYSTRLLSWSNITSKPLMVMKRGRITLDFASIRPILCFSIALLLIGGTASSPISLWIGYNQAFAAVKTNTTTAVSSNNNPSDVGQSVKFTATVTRNSGSGTPSGTVTFKDGSNILGTDTLDKGKATFSTSSLSVGSHSITAVYGGDNSFNVSTSSILTQTVVATTPGKPNDLEATAVSSSQINLSWQAPDSDGGSPIIDYKITRKGGDDEAFRTITGHTGSPATSYHDTGLSPATKYHYKVYANNIAGTGAPSSEEDETTLAADTTPPVITLNGAAEIFVELGTAYQELGAIALDLVDGQLGVTIGGDTVDPNTLGTYTITYSATDNAGNTGSASRTVIVHDTIAPGAPIISTESGTTKNNVITITGTAEAGSIVEIFDGGTSLGTAIADGESSWSFITGTLSDGAHTITATAKDASGNTSAHSSSIIITVDTHAPDNTTIDSLGPTNNQTPIISGTAEPGSTVEVFDGGTSLGTAIADGDGNWSLSLSDEEEELSEGTHSITATATDVAGNTSGASASLSLVIDITPPVITPPEGGITVEATAPQTLVSYSNALSFNEEVESVTCEPASGSLFEVGITSVTCTATDAAGNESEQVSFNVEITDHTLPVITLNGDAEITLEVGGSYEELGAAAQDLVDLELPVVIDGDTVDANTVGTYTITYSATDSHENEGTATRTVNVVDTTLPVISISGDNPVTLEVHSTYEDAGATALDNYDGDLTSSIVTVNPVDADLVGTYTVTYDVTDSSDNAAETVSRTVHVVDTTAPEISAPHTFVKVGTLVHELDEAGNPTLDEAGNEIIHAQVTYDVVASDNYIISDNVVCDTPSGGFLAVGTHTITCNVSDVAGNSATPVSFTVDILGSITTTAANLTIPPQGTITVTTSSGNEWSLMQTSTDTSSVSVSADTAPTTVSLGENQYTMGFIGQVLNITPASSTICSTDNPCTISITFTQADLDEQGLTLDQIRILHDANEDGFFDPRNEALDTETSGNDPFTATATVGSFSKFAIGGVKSVLFLAPLGGSGTLGPTVTQFSVSTAGAAGFAAILELDPNKPHTNVVDTFDPSTVTMRLAQPEGPQSITHVGIYLNLAGMFSRAVTDSDTYIVWDKNQPLQVVDPHGFMKGVDLKPSIIGKNLQLKLSVTFVKEMPKSDILVRAWDADLNTRNIRYKDAIQIVPPQTISPESNVPAFVKNNAAFWADGKITDSDFVQGIQYLIQQKIMVVPTVTGTTTPSVTGITPSVSGTTSPIISGTTTTPGIPAWIKNNAKWWSEDQITESDFLSGIQYLIAHGIVNVQ